MARPSWTPDAKICKRAKNMAARGLTVAQIADCLGVCEATIYSKQKEFPEFLEAIKRGRSSGMDEVTSALYEKAINGDNTAIIFYLKHRDRENWGEQVIEPVQEIPPIQIILDRDESDKATD